MHIKRHCERERERETNDFVYICIHFVNHCLARRLLCAAFICTRTYNPQMTPSPSPPLSLCRVLFFGVSSRISEECENCQLISPLEESSVRRERKNCRFNFHFIQLTREGGSERERERKVLKDKSNTSVHCVDVCTIVSIDSEDTLFK